MGAINMEIDITKLKSDILSSIDIDLTYSFSKEQLEGTDLLKLDDVKINGNISKDSINEYTIDVDVEGVMVLPCAITLEPVDYPFNVKINGNLEEMLEEINENSKKIENSIDIFPIIWENILMEIPMKVVSEKAKDIKLEGDGWRLITDEKREEINPEFAKLSQLFEEK